MTVPITLVPRELGNRVDDGARTPATMFDRLKRVVTRTSAAARNQYAVQVNVPTIGWITFATDIPHATAVDIGRAFEANGISPTNIDVSPADDLQAPAAPHVNDTLRDIPQPYETAYNSVPAAPE